MADRRSCLRLLPLFLAILSLACRAPASLSLLPATSSGRIEAAVRLPRAARLSLSWRASDPQATPGPAVVEVWLHRDGERGELLKSIPFNAAAPQASAAVDLGEHAGETCFLRMTAGSVPVTWTRADLTGRAWRGKGEDWRVAPTPGAPNVIVYLIDTLRPDVLGAYGGPGPTPTIDRLASEGVVFERAYSTTSWTRPAVASLFSSLPVSAHRVQSEVFSLPEGVLTLAERFRLRGYQTLGVVANDHVLPTFNFDQGFEIYDSPPVAEAAGATWDSGLETTNITAEQVHALALRHLTEARDPERPLFLYVHTVEPHSPYHPPEWLLKQARPAVKANNFLLRSINEAEVASPQLLQDLALQYRGAVAYADRELGKFLQGVAAHLDLGRTLLAVTSDHGEGFFEHYLVGHRHWLYEEMVRIPLILRGPGVPAGRHDAFPASLVDLAPTLLRLAGQPASSTGFLQGADLVNGGPSSRRDRLVYGEYQSGATLVKGEWKLTYHQEYPEAFRFALFNLRLDPAERINLLARRPEVARGLEAEFRGWHASAKGLAVEPLPVDVARLDRRLLQNLRALGYLK
jgi:arylsulfatase A-like enzyme